MQRKDAFRLAAGGHDMLNTISNSAVDFLPHKGNNDYIQTINISPPIINTTTYSDYDALNNSLNYGKKNTDTPLTFAARQHNSNLLYLLLDLEYSQDVGDIILSPEKMLLLQQPDARGETAIFHAIQANKLKSLKFLLQCGANIFHENKIKQTAIEVAYENGAWDCFLQLIKRGALFPRKFDIGFIPAKKYELCSLIENKENISELISNGKIKEVRRLIEEGYVTNLFKNTLNQSAITISFAKQKYEIFVLLRTRGFKELWHEDRIDINILSPVEKSLLKNVMASYVK